MGKLATGTFLFRPFGWRDSAEEGQLDWLTEPGVDFATKSLDRLHRRLSLRQHRAFLQSGCDAALTDGQDLDDNFATMARQMAGDVRAGLLSNVLLTQHRQHFHGIGAARSGSASRTARAALALPSQADGSSRRSLLFPKRRHEQQGNTGA